MMTRIYTQDINKTIYKKKFCIKIKNSDTSHVKEGEYITKEIYCILGKDVPEGTTPDILSDDTAYVFYKNRYGTLHAVHVTYRAKTIANMEWHRRKFPQYYEG